MNTIPTITVHSGTFGILACLPGPRIDGLSDVLAALNHVLAAVSAPLS
jgi:hypothetical protein